MHELVEQFEPAADMAAETDKGTPASYIPELGRVSPDHFGIALCLPDGTTLRAGDSGTPFSIQSISKVFTLSMALRHYGEDVWDRVGREPTGSVDGSTFRMKLRPRSHAPPDMPARW